MHWILFIKGILVGLGVSAPLGPMAMMVVQRTLNRGRRYGLLSGLGVGASDTTYAILAGFGLSVIIGFILDYQDVFKFVGAGVLVFVGMRLFLTKPSKIRENIRLKGTEHNAFSVISSMYLLTLSNPASLIILAGAFAGFGLIDRRTAHPDVVLLIVGVALGCVLWWIFLTFILSLLRKRIRIRHLFWINRVAGIVISSLGILALLTVFTSDVQMAV